MGSIKADISDTDINIDWDQRTLPSLIMQRDDQDIDTNRKYLEQSRQHLTEMETDNAAWRWDRR